MNTLKHLKVRYPYMLEGENIGISVPDGWINIFATLCQEIDTLLGSDKQGFHWQQCKEKFGSARWYWGMAKVKQSLTLDLMSSQGTTRIQASPKASDPVRAALATQLGELINVAEAQTQRSCIVCGEEGRLDRSVGWVLVLCPAHTLMHQHDELPRFWSNQ